MGKRDRDTGRLREILPPTALWAWRARKRSVSLLRTIGDSVCVLSHFGEYSKRRQLALQLLRSTLR